MRGSAGLIGLLLLALAPEAIAHTRSISYSFWELSPDSVSVSARVRQLDLSRVGLAVPDRPELQRAVAVHLADAFVLHSDRGICRPQVLRYLGLRDGWVQVQWTLDCPARSGLALHLEFLQAEAAHHEHYFRVHSPDGQVHDAVLSGEHRVAALGYGPNPPSATSASNAPGGRFGSFFIKGFTHLLGGWDHMAFLLGVLLLAARFTQLLWLVTGFTLGHSATLALAAFGRFEVSATAVELLIAASILFVACEVTWRRGHRSLRFPLLLCGGAALLAALAPVGIGAMWIGMGAFLLCYLLLLRSHPDWSALPMAMTLAFGLFHGFGFAGILAELELPTRQLVPALLGFNLGLEAAQIVLVAAAWPVLRWLQRRQPLAAPLLAATVAGIGCFALVLRLAA